MTIEFDTVLRGYDRDQVRHYVDVTERDTQLLVADRDAALSQAEDLARQLDAARATIRELQATNDRISRTPIDPDGLSQRLRRLVELATAEADDITRRAQAAADRTWRHAEDTAARLTQRHRELLTELDQRRRDLEAEHTDLNHAGTRRHRPQDTRGPLITGLLRQNPADRLSIPQALAMLNASPRPPTLSMTQAPWVPPSRRPERIGVAVAVLLSVAILVLAGVFGGPWLARQLSNSGGTTAFDPASLDRASTDKTPRTADALFPPSFTDSMNVVYTLRGSAVQSCVTDGQQDAVRRVLESTGCTSAIGATYVDRSDQILVSAWVVPLGDAGIAGSAYNQLPRIDPDSWGILYPPQGPGAQLATANPREVAAAMQDAVNSTSHRYLIHTMAIYIDLTEDPNVTQGLMAAASKAAAAVGPLNYSGNH